MNESFSVQDDISGALIFWELVRVTAEAFNNLVIASSMKLTAVLVPSAK